MERMKLKVKIFRRKIINNIIPTLCNLYSLRFFYISRIEFTSHIMWDYKFAIKIQDVFSPFNV